MIALSKWSVGATLAPFPLLFAAVAAGGAGGEGEERLPGSRVSLREAIRSSELIVVVRGVDMGKPASYVFSGKRFYTHVKLKVVKSLRGDAPREISPVRVTLITIPKAKETAPDRDKEYLFFLKGPSPTAVKVLRATDENLRATSEAISGVEKKP